jgi:hypothetical protein
MAHSLWIKLPRADLLDRRLGWVELGRGFLYPALRQLGPVIDVVQAYSCIYEAQFVCSFEEQDVADETRAFEQAASSVDQQGARWRHRAGIEVMYCEVHALPRTDRPQLGHDDVQGRARPIRKPLACIAPIAWATEYACLIRQCIILRKEGTMGTAVDSPRSRTCYAFHQ